MLQLKTKSPNKYNTSKRYVCTVKGCKKTSSKSNTIHAHIEVHEDRRKSIREFKSSGSLLFRLLVFGTIDIKEKEKEHLPKEEHRRKEVTYWY
jgi:hypothetical protein